MFVGVLTFFTSVFYLHLSGGFEAGNSGIQLQVDHVIYSIGIRLAVVTHTKIIIKFTDKRIVHYTHRHAIPLTRQVVFTAVCYDVNNYYHCSYCGRRTTVLKCLKKIIN